LNDEGVPNEVKAEDTADGAYFDGTIYLIADNLTDETILGTFVHELGVHKGFQEMMSPKAYELIMTQFNRLVEAKNPIALAAKQRAEEAESLTDEDKQGKTPQQILNMEKEALARQKDEYLPYLITEQAKNEQATPQQRNAVQRLIDHILRAVKGWVVRTLSKYDTTYNMSRRVSESLTPADIFYMAERMVGEIAKYEKPISPNKQSGMARREFLGLLGAGVGVAESAQNEAVGEQAEAVEDFNEEATAQSVGDILKQGDNAIVETLPTEEEKRAAINAAIFSDIGPWRANNIATGSVDSETE
jgi:hypothetical protein